MRNVEKKKILVTYIPVIWYLPEKAFLKYKIFSQSFGFFVENVVTDEKSTKYYNII